jgi:flagellar M-ring protein FliF
VDQLKQIVVRIQATITAFRAGNPQVFNLLAAALAIAAIFCAGLYALQPAAPVVVASNLAPADRTALALRLRRHQIDFRLGPDSILVAPRQAAEAEHLLAASPGFAGGAEDFSLFDRSTMGQSDFDEQVNYQRSLQGELERTIMDIHGIDSARVMLAMGRPSPFALGPSEAERASIMLTTTPGAVIDPATARAIAHLVAGSVRGLTVENVVVTGNDGAILYPPQRDGEFGEANRLRNELEHRFQEKISLLLNRIMGENRFAAEVSVAVDTSRVTRHDQLYGKSDQTVASEEYSMSSGAAQGGGIPGLTSNLPTPAPAPSPGASPQAAASPAAASPAATASPADAIQSAQHERTTGDVTRKDIVNYQPSSREVSTVTAPIRVGRITVAVVLDGTYDGGHFKPLPPDRLEAIKGLLAAAVGAEADRGDSVEVQSAPLSQPYVPPVPNPLTQIRELMSNPAHLYEAIGAALVVLALVLWFIKRTLSRLFRGKRAQTTVTVAAADQIPLAHAETPLLAAAESSAASATPVPGGSNEYEAICTKLNEEANRDPQAAAVILRKWLTATTADAAEANGQVIH